MSVLPHEHGHADADAGLGIGEDDSRVRAPAFPSAVPAAQLAPALQLKLPPPFSRRMQLLAMLQTPFGNILKYLSIQAMSSARVLRVPVGTTSSHFTVLLAEMMAAVFEASLPAACSRPAARRWFRSR